MKKSKTLSLINAFTGAGHKGKKGLLELAWDGMVFLDEIGEMGYHLQAKLLNILQDKEIYRVGGEKPIKINARVIATTNVDIEKLIED